MPQKKIINLFTTKHDMTKLGIVVCYGYRYMAYKNKNAIKFPF